MNKINEYENWPSWVKLVCTFLNPKRSIRDQKLMMLLVFVVLVSTWDKNWGFMWLFVGYIIVAIVSLFAFNWIEKHSDWSLAAPTFKQRVVSFIFFVILFLLPLLYSIFF